MSTRVMDIQIDAAGEAILGLEGYDRVLVLLRAGTVPLGLVTLPAHEGRVRAGALRDALSPETLARWAALRQEDAAGAPAPALTATVAICTHERPDDLARALAAVTALRDRGGGVLVVDNAPTSDSTRNVVAGFAGVRHVVEPRKGLDNARNRALAEATTDIVAFIDDDAVADPCWLDALVAGFRPGVGCVTGLTIPFELENAAQEEFEAMAGFSKRGLDRREFWSPPVHPLAVGAAGAGANMAIRRSIAQKIGPFDPALDAGTRTQSGGDHEYFTRILRSGAGIVYEPRALNRHRHRRTRPDMLKAVHGYGVGVYAAWTRSFVSERDWAVFRAGLGWFLHEQLPDLVRALRRRPGARPLDVVLTELHGCAKGPGAYLAARKLAREAEGAEP